MAQALRLLGRRALTDQALQEALAEDGYTSDDILTAMTQIRTWGYINDERLGDSVVAAAVRRKKGPAWLRQQLKSRKVPSAIASRCVEALADDAVQLAQDTLTRRFDAQQLREPRTALRALRLLQRRGFDGATCRQALELARTGESSACEPPWDACEDDPP